MVFVYGEDDHLLLGIMDTGLCLQYTFLAMQCL